MPTGVFVQIGSAEPRFSFARWIAFFDIPFLLRMLLSVGAHGPLKGGVFAGSHLSRDDSTSTPPSIRDLALVSILQIGAFQDVAVSEVVLE